MKTLKEQDAVKLCDEQRFKKVLIINNYQSDMVDTSEYLRLKAIL